MTMYYSAEVISAQSQVEAAALKALLADRYADDSDPWADAASEHADEELALSARDLVRAVEALPEGQRPVGWDEVAAP